MEKNNNKRNWKKCLCPVVQAQAELAMNHNLFHAFAEMDNLQSRVASE